MTKLICKKPAKQTIQIDVSGNDVILNLGVAKFVVERAEFEGALKELGLTSKPKPPVIEETRG